MKFFNTHNKKIIQSAKVGVIEVFIREDGNQSFSLGIYEKKNNAVKAKDEFLAEKEFDVLLEKLKDKNIPLVLCIDGKGILSRKLNIGLEELDESVPSRIIPNANAGDFYFEGTFINETTSLVTMMRKTAIDPLIDKIKEKGFFVIELHIGPPVIGTLSGLLTGKDDTSEIQFRNYKLVIAKEGILDISSGGAGSGPNSENDPKIQDEDLMLLFAGACSYFSEWNGMNGKTFAQVVDENKAEFSEKRKFSFYALAMVIFFLSILLINFLVFQHYHSKKQELESQIGWQENALKNYEELKTGMGEKMNFAMEAGILSPDNLAAMGDQLAATVPPEIKLNRMNVFPLEKKMEEGEEHAAFNKHLISVKGQSASGSAINEWIKEIRQQDFVEDVSLTNYKQDDEDQRGQFSLEIKIK